MDFETFLTTLYCMVDTFCKAERLVPAKSAGRPTSLCVSEILTLALFGQWAQFRSERAFYRWAERHLRDAFPTLPNYSQFNRLQRAHQAQLVAFFRYSVRMARRDWDLYEVLDGYGVAVRNKSRRGDG